MNTQFYQITPKPIVIQKSLKSFSIKIMDFIFNQSVTLLITLYDDTGIIHDNNYLTLEGEDYNKWSSDDNYIINYVCQKYNLTLSTL